jgi:ABC-type uncharacterized transport system auxiliary subunit
MQPAAALLVMLLIAGCVAGGKAPVAIDQYVLEYASPSFEGVKPSGEVMRVSRFAVAQAMNTPMMVYRSKPYENNVDYYNRWRVNPGDMVTDYLLRDMRSSGLFRAVFSYRDTEDGRYLLQGNVEDFLEVNDGNGRRAVITVHVSLLDVSQKEITRRVLFQKKYSNVENLEQNSASGFAQAMSKAMEKTSKQIIKEIVTALSGTKQ